MGSNLIRKSIVINFHQVFILYLMTALFRMQHIVTCLEQVTMFMLRLTVNKLLPLDEQTVSSRAKWKDIFHWVGSGPDGPGRVSSLRCKLFIFLYTGPRLIYKFIIFNVVYFSCNYIIYVKFNIDLLQKILFVNNCCFFTDMFRS
jgi:hypothetical protein